MFFALHYSAAIILAAGIGKRMQSDLPKVLISLDGQPIVLYVVRAIRESGISPCFMVVGYHQDRVRRAVQDPDIIFVEQKEQLGTGHAVLQTANFWKDQPGEIIVLNGDTPFIRPETVARLRAEHTRHKSSATVLSAHMADPTGYGRMVRSAGGQLEAIVEEKDATIEQKRISEINAGIYYFSTEALWSALQAIHPQNAQGEYYLTDTIAFMRTMGKTVWAYCVSDPREVRGINTPDDLKAAEAYLMR